MIHTAVVLWVMNTPLSCFCEALNYSIELLKKILYHMVATFSTIITKS